MRKAPDSRGNPALGAAVVSAGVASLAFINGRTEDLMTTDEKHRIDALRAAHGLPPLYCEQPRPLHHTERAFAIPRGRMRAFQASGYRYLTFGAKRFEPLVHDGWLLWREVTA